MLALGMRDGERVVLLLPDGRQIDVVVGRCTPGKTKLAIDAPQDIEILREKLLNTEKVRVDA
jgi:sRNA-binding carbon storage regulator CsrA